jgi:hypothetical protein
MAGRAPAWRASVRSASSGGAAGGFGAVYAFALSARTTSAAGAGMVLKVGKVGPNSDARFRSQHYTTSGRSTLAKSLLAHTIVWPWLGISQLDEASETMDAVKPPQAAHLCPRRGPDVSSSLTGSAPVVLVSLEMCVRARIGSVFEGSA